MEQQHTECKRLSFVNAPGGAGLRPKFRPHVISFLRHEFPVALPFLARSPQAAISACERSGQWSAARQKFRAQLVLFPCLPRARLRMHIFQVSPTVSI